jgi:hypothetical protein
MKMKLAIAFAVLFFALQARADEIQTSDGTMYIPDGSTVTSITSVLEPYDQGYVYTIDFSFDGGTGVASGNGYVGYGGNLYFTQPVSDLMLDWVGFPMTITDNVGDDFYFDTFDGNGQYDMGTAFFSGPGITSIFWASGADIQGGISSLDPTPADTPEPSALLLSAIGLTALIGLKLKA